MNDTRFPKRLHRRDFLKVGALTLGSGALTLFRGADRAPSDQPLPYGVGVNHPWIAYGHDFGKNAWGHDGIVASGWTYQTDIGSQGFTDARRCTEAWYSPPASLCITANLDGADPNRRSGEVYVDLRNHTRPEIPSPLDLSHATIDCKLLLPEGSRGVENAPNGVQLFFKSQEQPGDPWYSYYSEWENIQPGWEENWIPLTADHNDPAGDRDSSFNPAKIVAVGLKVGINDNSLSKLTGKIYLDDFKINLQPPIVFDFTKLELEEDFDDIRLVLGCQPRVVRFFLFANGAAAPEFSDGFVTGFDENFYEDLDAFFDAAQQRDFQLIPVLVDFHWCDLPSGGAVSVAGHSDILRDADKRQSYLDNALIPLIQRYAGRTCILAWDIINEPEWAVNELSPSVSDPVTKAQMHSFISACVQAIHDHSSHWVTVGSARWQWVSEWTNLPLDLYQFHYYDSLPLPPNPGWDKPCIVGEAPTALPHPGFREYIDATIAGGYQGLLAWSFRSRDDASDFQHARSNFLSFCNCFCTALPLVSR